MYVDESGGSDETVTSEDVTVTVDGHEYDVEKNLDIDGDGHVDGAVVHNDDGTKSTYVDEDADGDADIYLEADEHGNTVAVARFDEQSGEWVAADPQGGTTATAGAADNRSTQDASTGADRTITADMPQGELDVGPATIDTNEDGVNDTAVTRDDAGNTYYFTDANRDGEADYALVVESDGTTAALKHTGDGRWERVDDPDVRQTSGGDTGTGIGGDVGRAATDSGDTRANDTVSGITTDVQGVAKIDPHTGQWMSPN